MFLPTTREEMRQLGWTEVDVILITGDTYIDSPFIGAAVIGQILRQAGYRVGIIAQPDIHDPQDIARLGEPRLLWGVTSGSIDSMVANYTATRKRRRSDDLTPGGQNQCRPDRAVIVYANLIRRKFKNTAPICLGGIEASLRRIAHYDYWEDRVRRSILFDAKADFLIYGMGERAILELLLRIQHGQKTEDIRGICYAAEKPKAGFLLLPSLEEAAGDKELFSRMFHLFYQNNDPLTAQGLCQKQDTRYLVQNPPSFPLATPELDAVFELPYERDVHPFYKQRGKVTALETVRFSLTTHRGCYGECNFCAIALHQGRTVISRSEASVLREAATLAKLPGFHGHLLDVGGPTANMYGFECRKKLERGVCASRRCLYPEVCRHLDPKHGRQRELLHQLQEIPGIKKVFVASGIRYDLVLADSFHGKNYLKDIVSHHISGQMKIAPEHAEPTVLQRMGKPSLKHLKDFQKLFEKLNREAGKKQFLTYYLIAAHPGCTEKDMILLKKTTLDEWHHQPEQVQIFTPTPSTYSTLMYYLEKDPFTGEKIFVEKQLRKKQKQKDLILPAFQSKRTLR